MPLHSKQCVLRGFWFSYINANCKPHREGSPSAACPSKKLRVVTASASLTGCCCAVAALATSPQPNEDARDAGSALEIIWRTRPGWHMVPRGTELCTKQVPQYYSASHLLHEGHRASHQTLPAIRGSAHTLMHVSSACVERVQCAAGPDTGSMAWSSRVCESDSLRKIYKMMSGRTVPTLPLPSTSAWCAPLASHQRKRWRLWPAATTAAITKMSMWTVWHRKGGQAANHVMLCVCSRGGTYVDSIGVLSRERPASLHAPALHWQEDARGPCR